MLEAPDDLLLRTRARPFSLDNNEEKRVLKIQLCGLIEPSVIDTIRANKHL
ncbi:hypothetical protein L683_24945 [Pseudomonas aeruginosa WC55]|jgi:hypothetical protein|nr:hypothetical protein L683_24945 [Pseudomonas aeruginosa WC55]